MVTIPRKLLDENFLTGEYIEIDVMTLDQNDQPKKICNLILTRENIERALSNVKPPKNR